jgi:release factor glutamine methyltransferase
MLLNSWLVEAQEKLLAAGVGTARLDALVLLEDVTGKDRGWLLAHPEFELTQTQIRKLKNVLNRRAGHEPLAYIRGKTEFYGRTFLLTSDVLEPRPESETMIDLLKELKHFRHPGVVSGSHKLQDKLILRIADVGTGSGALGITAKLELPSAEVDLLEIDKIAIRVAKRNVDKFTLNISLVHTDLLTQAPQPYDVLLCNLPYVPDTFQINPAAMREPRTAIFGGPDGLDLYRRLFKQIKVLPEKPLYILSESLPPQHSVLAAIAKHHDYRLAKTDDFIQVFTTG